MLTETERLHLYRIEFLYAGEPCAPRHIWAPDSDTARRLLLHQSGLDPRRTIIASTREVEADA